MKHRMLFLTTLCLLAVVAQAQVAIIANPSVEEYAIDREAILKIYSLQKTTWDNGSAVVPFNLKTEGKTQEVFYDFLNRTPLEMRRLWMKASLSKTGKAPEGVGSEEEIVEKVASTPGAIGYVSATKVGKKVKVLLRIGR